MRELVRRIDAATPPGRDRAVDALRALAILGVVLGHWLVTALIADTGTVRAASPLQHMPELIPVSWLFQTLAVFFLVGGQVAAKSYASARARGTRYGQWLGARTLRLFRPVAAVLVVWTVIAGTLLASGVGTETVHALLKLVLSPLWFLLVFAALTAVTPLVSRLHPLWPLAVVLHVDLIRFGLGGPAWLGWINVAAGWLVPYCLGTTWARGGLQSRATGWALLLVGAIATAGLVLWWLPRVHGRGAGQQDLQPRPTHPRGRRLRSRPVRRGPAAARPAAAGPAPPCGLGGGGAGQPLRDDDIPLAPDRDDGGHRHRPARGRGAARTAHGAQGFGMGVRPSGVAAGVRRGAAGLLGGVP